MTDNYLIPGFVIPIPCESTNLPFYLHTVLCACWAVEALTRAGQHDSDLLAKARIMFEDLMGYANHVGLFSEEIAKDGSALGNMPWV